MKKHFKKIILLIILVTLSLSIFLYYKSTKLNLLISVGKSYLESKNSAVQTFNGTQEDIENDSNILKDVVYKTRDNKNLTLDIYKPFKKLSSHSPVILYVHGGSWAFGDKSIPSSMGKLLNLFRESGYTIISTSYELMTDKINFKNQVSDVKDTIRWIHKNKDLYSLNADEIGVLGVSSGAHLSLLAGYSNNSSFIGDNNLLNSSSSVKYIIDLFGPTDLNTLDVSKAYKGFKNIFNKINDKEQILSEFSPINYVHKDIPNTLIIHSKEDSLVPFSNAQKLYDECLKYNASTSILELNYSGHDLSSINDKDIKSLAQNILKFIFKNTSLF